MKRIFRKPQIGPAQMKRNRSAVVRDALREHLRRLEVRALEERDREGYAKRQAAGEFHAFESEAAWLDE